MENDPADVGYDVVEGEPRWTVVGHTKSVRVLIIVWTARNGKLRIVTALEAQRSCVRIIFGLDVFYEDAGST